MPLPFLSHQAPVLPLKILAPRWWDGTALVIGSMAPDLVFVLGGTPLEVDGHAALAQVWLCLPITLLLTLLTKRVLVGTVVPHLPDAGGFHLHDYIALKAWRPQPRAILVAVWSGLLGSTSHIAVDSFTHGFGWAVKRIPALGSEVAVLPTLLSGRTVHVYDLLQVALTLLGAMLALGMLRHIGQNRLICQWYGPRPAIPLRTDASRRRFAIALGAGLTVAGMVSLGTSRTGGAQHVFIRSVVLAIAAIIIAGAAAPPCGATEP